MWKISRSLHPVTSCTDIKRNRNHLVDDESPDNCPQICDRYVAKYTYVKVVHKKMMVLDRLATAVWKSPQVNISHLLIVMIL